MNPIDPQELRAIARRIAASGVLGRSKTYAAILDYLVECSIAGETPKEAAIAVDVLGREADFDVAKDSIVRVHVYHLRNKLEQYYARDGRDEKYRLEIPKGQYLLVARRNEPEEVEEEGGPPGLAPEPLRRRSLTPALAVLAALLVLLNLWLALQDGERIDPHADVRAQVPWRAIFDDDAPVLFVIGDYFIFGELDETGNVRRMVREFDINSAEDLDMLVMLDPDAGDRYYNLGLTYTPTGIAPALMDIMPLFHDQGRRVSVKMMSAVNASDLTSNHVVYLGYISGLDLLGDLVFAGSALGVGNTYDELRHRASGRLFISDSGIRSGGQYRDYGLISTFPSPRGHQIVILAGTRDAGLINVAQQASVAGDLAGILAALAENVEEENGQAGLGEAWEALFEVYGYDHTNFDARLVHGGALQAGRIWSGRGSL